MMVHWKSPNMLILQGFTGRLGMALSITLPRTTEPFSSVLGAVIPDTGVTLALAHNRDALQLGGSVFNSHLMYRRAA